MKQKILLVDDEVEILQSFKRQLRKQPFDIHLCESGAQALEFLEENPDIDLVISDMRMPNMDGAELLAKVAHQWPSMIRILLTGFADTDSAAKAINEGRIYSYQTKPWDNSAILTVINQALSFKRVEDETRRLESMVKLRNDELKSLNSVLEEKVKQRTAQLKENYRNTILVFSQLINKREQALGGTSSAETAKLARQIAQTLQLDKEQVKDIFIAAHIQNIALLGYADELKKLPFAQLSAEQQQEYKKHVILGEAILMQLEDMENIAQIVRSHHEKHDGSGYPDQLVADQIPLGAQILSLIDDYQELLQLGSTEQALQMLLSDFKAKHHEKLLLALQQVLSEDFSSPKVMQQEISSKDLRPAMVLSQDIFTQEGVLLLPKDIQLDIGLIRKLMRFEKDEQSAFKIFVYQ